MIPAPSHLTLREKIGQLLIVGFRGCHPAECAPSVRDIREHGIGGIVLFDQDMIDGSAGRRNIESPAQVKALLAFLQSHASIPLLTSIDQEGGRVNRLKPAYGFPRVSPTRNSAGSTSPPKLFATPKPRRRRSRASAST